MSSFTERVEDYKILEIDKALEMVEDEQSFIQFLQTLQQDWEAKHEVKHTPHP